MISQQLKKRIRSALGEHPLTDQEISNVEEALSVKLSKEFIELNKVCSYEYNNVLSFLNFGGYGHNSVIESTLGVWAYFNCPHDFIILYDDGSGVVFMDVKSNSGIVYASIEDTENIVFRKKLNYQHDLFLTFADFYIYLLDEEEKSVIKK